MKPLVVRQLIVDQVNDVVIETLFQYSGRLYLQQVLLLELSSESFQTVDDVNLSPDPT